MTWTTSEAIKLCRFIEAVAPEYGCHVALTGGLLYKSGERKDCDLVLYRIRQAETIDVAGLFDALSAIGLAPVGSLGEGMRFVVKAQWHGKAVDFMFPEAPEGDYSGDDAEPDTSTPDDRPIADDVEF